MPRKRKQYGRMEVSLDPAFHREIEQLAKEVGISAPAWGAMAIAAYYAKWRSPRKLRKSKTGSDLRTEGQWCNLCDVSAGACEAPEQHSQLGAWYEVEGQQGNGH